MKTRAQTTMLNPSYWSQEFLGVNSERKSDCMSLESSIFEEVSEKITSRLTGERFSAFGPGMTLAKVCMSYTLMQLFE
jgi:hypothetical protein